MKHYYFTLGEFFGNEIIPEGATEITVEEINAYWVSQVTPEKLAQQAKAEAQAYLDKTDHKFYGDYEPKEGEDLEAIRVKRSEARALLRGEVTNE